MSIADVYPVSILDTDLYKVHDFLVSYLQLDVDASYLL